VICVQQYSPRIRAWRENSQPVVQQNANKVVAQMGGWIIPWSMNGRAEMDQNRRIVLVVSLGRMEGTGDLDVLSPSKGIQ